MSRPYQGYAQANQSLLEEEEENRSNSEEERLNEDMDAGRSRSPKAAGVALSKSKSHGKRKVSWDAGASEMNVLHPNIHQEDKIHEQESSDDEVPQSFMIEATSRKPSGGSAKGKQRDSGRRQPLYSASGRKLPPILPTHATPGPSVSIPPRPSDVDPDNEYTPRPTSAGGYSDIHSDRERQPTRQMRGLDAYERALWNWVNVYNLDAFLQDVYYYYEGKGIYSIALARGLNLLSVTFIYAVIGNYIQYFAAEQLGSSLGSRHFCLGASTIHE